MANASAPQGVFSPTQSKQESKASTTNSVSRSIVEAETKQREAKTAKLRALRMLKEAEAPTPVAPKKVARKRA
ncbi:hypothetical protein [Mesorhizobium marinum]|uniref:hypothetical protein n=1 Tax=Mesorhizobium marinum TaxID=3228790 RepID=UPI0034671C2B